MSHCGARLESCVVVCAMSRLLLAVLVHTWLCVATTLRQRRPSPLCRLAFPASPSQAIVLLRPDVALSLLRCCCRPLPLVSPRRPSPAAAAPPPRLVSPLPTALHGRVVIKATNKAADPELVGREAVVNSIEPSGWVMLHVPQLGEAARGLVGGSWMGSWRR